MDRKIASELVKISRELTDSSVQKTLESQVGK